MYPVLRPEFWDVSEGGHSELIESQGPYIYDMPISLWSRRLIPSMDFAGHWPSESRRALLEHTRGLFEYLLVQSLGGKHRLRCLLETIVRGVPTMDSAIGLTRRTLLGFSFWGITATQQHFLEGGLSAAASVAPW